jgi:hypothetical protein
MYGATLLIGRSSTMFSAQLLFLSKTCLMDHHHFYTSYLRYDFFFKGVRSLLAQWVRNFFFFFKYLICNFKFNFKFRFKFF